MRVMKYDDVMGKSVLLLGKTRSLNRDEFETLLKLHAIGIKERFDEEVALIIEGRMMNPLQQDEVARLYQEENIPIVEISKVERWLCESLDPNRLLMSLKLSCDQERLVDFIQNPYITDELFFKLLKLYDWQGEGLFDNDTNRDVTAAVIGRFYVDLGRNHNVQYAMSGLAHLVEKYGNAELITAISQLAPIAKELKNPSEPSLKGVLDAMALHSDTPEGILKQLLPTRAALLAHREPLGLESELLALNDEMTNEILAKNPSLSSQGANRLEQHYPTLIASCYPLDERRFERLLTLVTPYSSFVIPCDDTESVEESGSRIEYGMTENEYGMTKTGDGMGAKVALASNPTLTASMQERLMAMKDETIFSALARNPALFLQYLEQLFTLEKLDEELASNPSLPQEYLKKLYEKGEEKTLKALSANVSTPVELLHQLSLDQKYERYVKTNAAFGKHIQTYNIGWND